MTKYCVNQFKHRTGVRDSDLIILKNSNLFQNLSEEGICVCLEQAFIEEYGVRTDLFHQGDPSDHFYMVLEGAVRLTRDAQRIGAGIIRIVHAGEVFADDMVVERAPYSLSASVIREARLLVVPTAPFFENVERDSALAFNFMSALAQKTIK